MKKLMLIGMAAVIFAGTAMAQDKFISRTSASPAVQFLDLPADQNYQKAIAAAVEHGYVDAPEKSEGQKFYPDKSVSRAEFVKMLVTAKKLPVTGEIIGGGWYKPYVKAAREAHITDWSEDAGNDFWNASLPREEMAQLSIRAADASAAKNTEQDKWLFLATQAGLIVGVDNAGTLAEKEPTKKVHSVTIIERVLGNVDHPADKYAQSNAEILWHKTNILTMLPQYFLRRYLDDPDKKIDTSKFKYVGENGSSEVEKYVVVDLDDPNDPNRKYIPEKVRWKGYSGNTLLKGEIGELPTNAYGLFSVNHVVVNADQDNNFFRVKSMFIDTNEAYSPELLAAGKPAGGGALTTYDEKHEEFLSNILDVKQGYNDIRWTSGQFLPKEELTFKKEKFVYISLSNAAELGQHDNGGVYGSKVDYSLTRK